MLLHYCMLTVFEFTETSFRSAIAQPVTDLFDIVSHRKKVGHLTFSFFSDIANFNFHTAKIGNLLFDMYSRYEVLLWFIISNFRTEKKKCCEIGFEYVKHSKIMFRRQQLHVAFCQKKIGQYLIGGIFFSLQIDREATRIKCCEQQNFYCKSQELSVANETKVEQLHFMI